MELTEGHTNPAYETHDDKLHGDKAHDETNLHHHTSSNGRKSDDDDKDELPKDSGDKMKSKKVVFLGSGDMTLALSVAMSRACLQPVVGSRHPERAKVRLKDIGAIVTTVNEALSHSDIVILAIPADHHHSLPRQELKNKIVVDISNRAPGTSSRDQSLAEKLQEILPESHVVKAFNTISAYALQHGNIQGSREVPICSNDERARGRVSELTRDLGLTPVDRGALRNAREVEDIPLSFFPEWKVAGVMTLVFFVFWYIFMLFRNQICPNLDSGTEWNWELFQTFPLMNTQFAMAYTATCLLLFTYIPGTMAAYLQLYRGTKYSHFPNWLDKWLKSRKQTGLLALLIGTTHGCSAIFTQIAWTVREEWDHQLHFMFAALLTASLAVLGITSLPSVSARLTWREFSILQRYLGWFSVFCVTVHAIFSDFKHLYKPEFVCIFLPLGTQVIVAMCLLTILAKLPLLLPCVDSHLDKIRRGYERGGGGGGGKGVSPA
ncbi:metalloreductase STEAP4-like [Penaeus japonicus]|uniref:metalloreductase STEAP4-like n=1 Tax=Penaeus japonicus TaxID=27405 RepID=UPI001C715FB5|nr:metalloreductase STEAP4-like [Penaeus japonicus]